MVPQKRVERTVESILEQIDTTIKYLQGKASTHEEFSLPDLMEHTGVDYDTAYGLGFVLRMVGCAWMYAVLFDENGKELRRIKVEDGPPDETGAASGNFAVKIVNADDRTISSIVRKLCRK